MTKQFMATLAAILVTSTMTLQGQLTTTTKTTKVAPGTTKTTVVTTDRGVHSGTAKKTSAKRRPATHMKKAPVESTTARELRELREQMTAQQAQIDALKEQNAAKDAALANVQQSAQGAEAAAQAAAAKADSVSSSVTENKDAVTTLNDTVTNLKTANEAVVKTVADNQKKTMDAIENPAVLHYKGLTITPVAFFALESVYRTRALNAGLNTPFNATPFPGANESHISEFNFSGRQSRLGGLFEGNAGAFKLSGYFEADFLSAGVTSNNNQSNSYTLRQRQIWGKAETKGGFAVTGGQMWSLVTENGKGTDARTEKLPNTIDPQYMVGYNWTRQPGIRFQQKLGNPFLGNAVTVAMSLEQAQIQFAGANAPGNFIFGGTGNGGGLYNAFNGVYANNVAPDVLVKVAMDGKRSHFEFGGMARFFRDEYYPLVVSPVTGITTSYSKDLQRDTKVGGGVFGSGRVTVSKYLDLALQGMAGQGTGRYGSSQLGDVTAHPDGTLEPLRNYHGLLSVETHPTPRLDVYAYYGAEYNQRTIYLNNAKVFVGYGVPSLSNSGCNVFSAPPVGTGTGVTGSGSAANCNAPTRAIQEGTIGYTYRIVNSPKFGKLQYQMTYSYLTRETWKGLTSGVFNTPTATFGAGRATNNLVYAGMRYYIP